MIQGPIDLVYLWCDGSDKKWSEQRALYWSMEKGTAFSQANEESRFFDCSELRFSIRSAFASGVFRNIFIVTDGQRPSWLRETERIRIVDHGEIIPAGAIRPLYNSFAIESYVHRISGLAEYFVLANDDFFFGSSLTATDFFTPTQKMKIRVMPNLVSASTDGAGWAQSCYYTAAQVFHLFSGGNEPPAVLPYYAAAHIGQICSRSVANEAEKLFSFSLARTRATRFRGPECLYPMLLWSYLAIEKNLAVLAFAGSEVFYARDMQGEATWRAQFEELRQRNPKLFCLNATYSPNLERWQRFVEKFLPRLFSLPSPAEKEIVLDSARTNAPPH